MIVHNVILTGTLLGTAHISSQEHYKERYGINPHIGKVLDAHSTVIAKKLLAVDKGSKKHGVWKFEWLPGYYVKYGLVRIAGMEKMREAITRCNLTSLMVPDKRIYHVKGTPETLSNSNYAIIIENVEAAKNVLPITVDEVKQLCTLMHETGYIDVTGSLGKKGPNYIRTAEGKFCMIDTESAFDHQNLIKGFMRFLQTHDLNDELSEEALKYIFEEIQALLREQPSKISETLTIMRDCFKMQKKPHAWDYEGYVKKHFKKLLETVRY